MTRISVCMASYNGAIYIEKQISSILTQLNTSDELIISDDFSTDNTISLINGFDDTRIKLVRNPLPRSVTRNFENALINAQGQYIFLADQDDLWYPNKVNNMLEALQKVNLVISDCDFVNGDGQLLGRTFFDSFNSGPGVLKNFIKNTYLGNCMAFDRSVLESILPFPKEIHLATEYLIFQDVWIGIVANSLHSISFLPLQLSAFRRHQSNASPTNLVEKSPQSLSRKIRGRILLALALLKRFSRIA